jgi:hypothetical protein
LCCHGNELYVWTSGVAGEEVSPTARGGFEVSMLSGKQALRAELCRRFPSENAALNAYFQAVEVRECF